MIVQFHPTFMRGGFAPKSWMAPATRLIDESDVSAMKAFTFVRHPIPRFISGYSTVVNRLGRHRAINGDCMAPQLKKALNNTEPQRFVRFVDLFVHEGERIINFWTC